MSPGRAPQFVSIEIARRWLERARVPAEWGVTPERFQVVLERSAKRRFCDSAPEPRNLESYFAILQIRDLALSCACSAGNEAAWDLFVREFRPELYRAARAIAGDSNPRELADSLYGELYGMRESEGVRKSLFDYFHGRSKLSTWLRAILAQRHVDEIRRSRRTEPLEDANGEVSAEATVKVTAAASGSDDPERGRYLAILQATLTALLNALSARDRLRLAYYYVEELTLAEIGKLMGEHEATVSRKLERTRRDLRAQIEAALREKKLSDAQLRLCYEYARDEWPFDLTLSLRSGQGRALSARD
ncbi:MAG TPA: sigma-70 family RNA polymerase sigma factor [Candidatus Acidoferrum sp.]|nr:sigma-70 family RNA polymerase sigma factor [Candidatus Acidoferrum sp.]